MDNTERLEGEPKERRALADVSAEIGALDKQIEELSRRKSALVIEHDEIAAAENPVPMFF